MDLDENFDRKRRRKFTYISIGILLEGAKKRLNNQSEEIRWV
jgi:hypothetical protein